MRNSNNVYIIPVKCWNSVQFPPRPIYFGSNGMMYVLSFEVFEMFLNAFESILVNILAEIRISFKISHMIKTNEMRSNCTIASSTDIWLKIWYKKMGKVRMFWVLFFKSPQRQIWTHQDWTTSKKRTIHFTGWIIMYTIISTTNEFVRCFNGSQARAR